MSTELRKKTTSPRLSSNASKVDIKFNPSSYQVTSPSHSHPHSVSSP